MSTKIQVSIKFRPLIERERSEGATIYWDVVNTNQIVQRDPVSKKQRGEAQYFDRVFSENEDNTDVFNAIVKPIVEKAVNGFNGTVFAYGQTSSGKTHTMRGSREDVGITQQTVDYIFALMKSQLDREFLIRVSYIEIYNEKINDLLKTKNTNLKLREEEPGQVTIQGAAEEVCNSVAKIMQLVARGEQNRRIAETNMNERSSRSHTIFRLIMESQECHGGEGAIQVSHLNLVDLAGSEKTGQMNATGIQFKEGCNINKSLSTLGKVISDLSDGKEYINFRDSNLTRILQNSLGGNALTAIVCTVTPAALDQTLNTLGFATRAKTIKNRPTVNEVLSGEAMLKRYARQLAKLQADLAHAKGADIQAMSCQLREKDELNERLQQRIDLIQEKLINSTVAVVDEASAARARAKRRQTWCGKSISAGRRLTVFGLSSVAEEDCDRSGDSAAPGPTDRFETPLEDFEQQLIESEEYEMTGLDSFPLGSSTPLPPQFSAGFVTVRRKGDSTNPSGDFAAARKSDPIAGRQAPGDFAAARKSDPAKSSGDFVAARKSDATGCRCSLDFVPERVVETKSVATSPMRHISDDPLTGSKSISTSPIKHLSDGFTIERDSVATSPVKHSSTLFASVSTSPIKHISEGPGVLSDADSGREVASGVPESVRRRLAGGAPETPTGVLRDRAADYSRQLEELKEFTELERQMQQDELKEQLRAVEAENRRLEAAVGRLQRADTDREVEREMAEAKHRRREQDLKASLEEAYAQINSQPPADAANPADPSPEVELLAAQLAEQQTANRALSQQLLDLERSLESSSLDRAAADGRNAELASRLDRVQAELSAGIEARTRLESDLAELALRLDSAAAEKSELAKRNEDLESRMAAAEIRTGEARLKLESDLAEISSMLEAVVVEKSELEGRNEDLENRIKAAEVQASETRMSLESDLAELASRLESAVVVKSELEKETGELKTQVTAAEIRTKAKMDSDLAELASRLESVIAEKSELERRNEDLENRMKTSEIRTSESRTKLESDLAKLLRLESAIVDKSELEERVDAWKIRAANDENSPESESRSSRLESTANPKIALEESNARLLSRVAYLESRVAVLGGDCDFTQTPMKAATTTDKSEDKSAFPDSVSPPTVGSPMAARRSDCDPDSGAASMTESDDAELRSLRSRLEAVVGEKSDLESRNRDLEGRIATLETLVVRCPELTSAARTGCDDGTGTVCGSAVDIDCDAVLIELPSTTGQLSSPEKLSSLQVSSSEKLSSPEKLSSSQLSSLEKLSPSQLSEPLFLLSESLMETQSEPASSPSAASSTTPPFPSAFPHRSLSLAQLHSQVGLHESLARRHETDRAATESSLRAELQSATGRLEESFAAYAALTELAERLSTQRDNSEALVSSLRSSLMDVRREHAVEAGSLRRCLEAAEAETGRLELLRRNLERRNAVLEDGRANLEARMKVVADRKGVLEAEKAELVTQLQSLEARAECLEERATSLESLLEESGNRNRALFCRSLDELGIEKADMGARIKILVDQKNILEEEKSELETRLRDMETCNKSLEEQLTLLGMPVEELGTGKASVEDVESRMKNLVDQKNSLEEEKTRLEIQLQDLESRNKYLEELGMSVKELETRKADMEKMESGMKILVDQRNSLEEEKTRLQTQLQDLETRNKSLEEQLTSLEMSMEESGTEKENLVTQMKILVDQKQSLDREKTRLEEHLQGMETKTHGLETRNKSLEEQLTSLEMSLEESGTEKVNMESRMKTLVDQNIFLEEEKTRLETQSQDLEELLTSLRMSLEESGTEKSEMEGRLRILVDRNIFLEEEKTRLLAQLEDLDSHNESVNERLASLGTSASEYQSVCCRLQAVLAENEKLSARISKKDQYIAEMVQVISDKDQDIAKKDQDIAQKVKAISEKDQDIAEKVKVISEKDQDIAEKVKVISEKDQDIAEKVKVISEKDQDIAEKDQDIAQKVRVISEKDQDITEKVKVISEKDQDIAEKVEVISEKDQDIAQKVEVISEKDQDIAEKVKVITEKDQDIAEKVKVISEKDQDIAQKVKVITEKEKDIAEKVKEIEEKVKEIEMKDQEIAEKVQAISEKDKEIAALSLAPPPAGDSSPAREAESLRRQIDSYKKALVTEILSLDPAFRAEQARAKELGELVKTLLGTVVEKETEMLGEMRRAHRDETRSLRAQVDTLEGKMRKNEAWVSEVEREHEKLQLELHEATASLLLASTELRAARREAAASAEARQELGEEVTRKEAELVAAEAELAEIRAGLREGAKVSFGTQRIRQLEQLLDEQVALHESARQKISNTESQVECLLERNHTLRREAEALREATEPPAGSCSRPACSAEIARLREEAGGYERRTAALLRRKFDGLDVSLDEDDSVESTIDAVIHHLLAAGAGATRLERTAEEAKGRAEEWRAEAARLERRLAEEERVVRERDEETSRLERAIGERDAKIAGLERDIAERSAEMSRLERSIKELDAKSSELERNAEESLSKLSELGRTMGDIMPKASKLVRDAGEREADLSEPCGEGSACRERVAELEEQLRLAADDNRFFDEENEVMLANLNAAVAEKRELSARAAELEGEAAALRARLDMIAPPADDELTRLEAKQAEIARAQEQLASAEQEKMKALKERDRHRAYAAKYAAQVTELEARLGLSESDSDCYASPIGPPGSDGRSVAGNRASTKGESEADPNQPRYNGRVPCRDCAELREKTEALNIALAERNDDISKMEAELSSLRRKARKAVGDLGEKLRGAAVSLQERGTEVEALREELQVREADVKALKERLKAAEAEAATPKEAAEVEALRKKLQACKMELIESNGQVARLRMQVDCDELPFKTEVKALRREAADAASRMAQLKAELRRAQMRLQNATVVECAACASRPRQKSREVQTDPPPLVSAGSGIMREHSFNVMQGRVAELEEKNKIYKHLAVERLKFIKQLEEEKRLADPAYKPKY